MIPQTPTLVLASRSSRRAQLLRDRGYRYVQVTPPFDDPPQPEAAPTVSPESLTMQLAEAKARSTLRCDLLTLPTGSVILAADTVVVAPDGGLLGQPQTRQGALHMLHLLVNHTHRVYTGVSLVDPANGECKCFCDWASVHLGPVDPATLHVYTESDQWRGKAGGYNLLDLQAIWPFTVTGDPTTVAGLPMAKLAEQLRGFGTHREHGYAPNEK